MTCAFPLAVDRSVEGTCSLDLKPRSPIRNVKPYRRGSAQRANCL